MQSLIESDVDEATTLSKNINSAIYNYWAIFGLILARHKTWCSLVAIGRLEKPKTYNNFFNSDNYM
jgi:hypothetical protein